MPRWSQLEAMTSEIFFGEAQGGGPQPRHLSACRCDGARRALPLSLVGSAPGPDGGDLVRLGDLLLDGELVVREGSEQHAGDLPCWFEQVRAHDLLEDDAVLSAIVEPLEVSAHNGLVLFCGHHRAPLVVSLPRMVPLGATRCIRRKPIHRVAGKGNSANFAFTEF